MLTEEQRHSLGICRGFSEYCRLRKEFESGDCSFCNFDRKKSKVHLDKNHVMMFEIPKERRWGHLSLHLIIVPKQHVRFEAELNDDSAAGVREAKIFAFKELGYRGGIMYAKEGDAQISGATVHHVHFHLMQPNQSGDVKIPVFDLGGLEERIARLDTFDKRWISGERI